MSIARVLVLLALLLWIPQGRAASADDLLPVDEAFQLQHALQPDGSVTLRWAIAPGYYLYRHRTQVREPAGSLQLPDGEPHDDPFFGPVQTYRQQLHGRWQPATAGAPHLQLEYQGCADAGVCYPPQRRTLVLNGTGTPAAPDAAAQAAVAATASAATPAGTSRVSLFWALGLALLGGLVLNLMPCVLPVLSLKVLGLANSGASPRHARAHALAYSAGVLMTFALLGGTVLLIRTLGHGIGWGAQLQQPVVVAGLAYLMVALRE